MANKTTKEEIKELLELYPNAVEKGIKTIFKLQTDDEKRTDSTNHHNNVGFSGADAYILSAYAKQLLGGKRLSIKQLELAKKKMKKYAGQLAKIANGEIQVG